MTNLEFNNLVAWATLQGYDEDYDYTVVDLPEGYVSKHFREAEFTCNHCGKLHPDGIPDELVNLLERVRNHFNQPVIINSGYRCPTHNANVGGAAQSTHLKGLAADIVVKNVDPADVVRYLSNHEGGLGSYATFTHVDVRGSRARWTG